MIDQTELYDTPKVWDIVFWTKAYFELKGFRLACLLSPLVLHDAFCSLILTFSTAKNLAQYGGQIKGDWIEICNKISLLLSLYIFENLGLFS